MIDIGPIGEACGVEAVGKWNYLVGLVDSAFGPLLDGVAEGKGSESDGGVITEVSTEGGRPGRADNESDGFIGIVRVRRETISSVVIAVTVGDGGPDV